MPKPPKVDYTPIIAEYQAGLATVSDLARKYKIKRATLAKYISVNNIEISNTLKDGINALDKGLDALKVTKESAISNDLPLIERERQINAIEAGLNYLEANHGRLATFVAKVVEKGFIKGQDMLDIAETPDEYASVMRGLKTGADTLGLFPKSPLVAIQQNISKEFNQKIGAEKVQISVNFIDSKKDDENIIDAEVENER